MSNREQAEYWESRAESWLGAERLIERVGGAFGRLAMDAMALEPGDRVVDIGSGSGGTTLELADRVAPGGDAVGADISPALIRAAQERAATVGSGNVRFVEADAQVDELGEGFDAAFSRFGVMFFADPVAAFANIRGALRPGGVVAFVCWQDLSVNEWMLVPGSAAVRVTGRMPALDDDDAPGPFSLAEPGRAERVLAAAGFEQIEVRAHTEPVVIDEADIAEVVHATTLVGMVREALVDADDRLRLQVLEAVESALRDHLVDGRVRLAAGVFVVSARRP